MDVWSKIKGQIFLRDVRLGIEKIAIMVQRSRLRW